jgi:thaumarchaeosortase
MLDVIQKVKKNIHILERLLPLLSFIVPFLALYLLYPRSFEGDPAWEGSWHGRFFYLFFLWLVSLEIILNWEKLQTNKVNKLRSLRTFTLIIAFLLPTIYVIAANYSELNAIIVDLAEQNNVPFAHLMPLSIEYLVFAMLFNLIILLAYGTNGVVDFSISAAFLGIIGMVYVIDSLYPYGRFAPFQFIVPTTAMLAANVLNLIGFQTRLSVVTSSYHGSTPLLVIWDSQNRVAGFKIAWPCAGVESLLIYTLTILLFLKRSLIPWKQKIIYFVIGALVTYFINILRIVTVFVIAINGGDWLRFHNIYGQLYSITWIISYPLIIIGSRILWQKIRCRKLPHKVNKKSTEEKNA